MKSVDTLDYFALGLATIAGSILACGAQPLAETPEGSIGTIAPAELVEPFVPDGTSVDPSIVDVLSLDDLLIFADENAPAIRQARARVGAVEAEWVEAEIVYPDNPVVSFGLGGRTSGGATGFEFEVALEQQLELGNLRDDRRALAQSREDQALAVVNEVRWLVHVEVHRLYLDLLLALEQAQQAEHFVEFAESLLRTAEAQVDAGESSPLVLLVAQADVAASVQGRIEAQLLADAVRVRLASVIGWPDRELPAVAGDLPPIRVAPPHEELLALMAEHHPAVRTRELAVVAGYADLQVQLGESRVDPTVGVEYGHEAGLGTENDANVWMLTVQIPLPLWRSNQTEIVRAEAEIDLAMAQRDADLLSLQAELLEAALVLDAAAETVALYASDIIPQLEQNLDLLLRAYDLGEVDLHQVSQTRERLLEATASYLDARVAYYEAAAHLEGLVGTEVWGHEEIDQ